MFVKSNGPGRRDGDVLEHIDGLYSYALVLAHNRSDADDLVQETYVRAISSMERLRADSNVRSWLFTILRNVWLNQLRQQRCATCVPVKDIEGYFVDTAVRAMKDPHSLLISEMDRQQVREAIQKLPTDFREIILLREYEELSYQAIATILDCPTGTVRSRLGRARAKLRKILSATTQVTDSGSIPR